MVLMVLQDEASLQGNFPSPSLALQGPLSFFGVFDGHGGSPAASFTKDNIHRILVTELQTGVGIADAFTRAFLRLDDEFIKSGGLRLPLSTSFIDILWPCVMPVLVCDHARMLRCFQAKVRRAQQR